MYYIRYNRILEILGLSRILHKACQSYKNFKSPKYDVNIKPNIKKGVFGR